MTTPYGLTSPFDGTVDTADGKRGKMLCAGAMAAVSRAMAAMEDDRGTKRFPGFLLIELMEGWLGEPARADLHPHRTGYEEAQAQSDHRERAGLGHSIHINVIDSEIHGWGRNDDVVEVGAAAGDFTV